MANLLFLTEQFRTCIGTLGVNLTAQETNDLLARFRVNDNSNHINYRTFVNELDTVFGEDVDTAAVIQNARTTAVSYTFALLPETRISDARQIQIGLYR